MIIRALGLSIHRINANQSLQRTGENPPAADLFVGLRHVQAARSRGPLGFCVSP